MVFKLVKAAAETWCRLKGSMKKLEATETLEVEFHETGLYQYFNVPSIVYESLMTGPSQGVFFNANFRGQFAYERL